MIHMIGIQHKSGIYFFHYEADSFKEIQRVTRHLDIKNYHISSFLHGGKRYFYLGIYSDTTRVDPALKDEEISICYYDH